MGRPRLDETKIKRIAKLILDGLDNQVIAERIGVRVRYVSDVRRRVKEREQNEQRG